MVAGNLTTSIAATMPWFTAPLLAIGQSILGGFCMSQTRRDSRLRPLALVMNVVMGIMIYQTCAKFSSSGYYNSYITSIAFVSFTMCTNLLHLLALDSSDLNQLKEQYFSKDANSFLLGTMLTLNYRGIRTPWLVKNCPDWPAYYKLPAKDASSSTTRRPAPPREAYMLRQIAFASWQYLVFDLVNSLPPPPAEEAFPPGAEFRYLNATSEQWITRILSSLLTWYVMARIVNDLVYRVLGFIAIGIGIASPEDFPPLFGSMWQAYTIRNYWGKFWHQMLRWGFTSFSTFLTKDVLQLPKPSLLERYTNIGFVFLLSGLMHYFFDASHLKGHQIGTIMFFQSFALGIMIEDGIQELWHRINGANGNESKGKIKARQREEHTPLWQKAVGFIWVAAWICAVSPWYMYPGQRFPRETFWILPFSVVEKIGIPIAASLVVIGGVILSTVFKGEI